MNIKDEQEKVCKKYAVEPLYVSDEMKVGISVKLKDSLSYPINGLRHLPNKDTSGWYIWAGDYSEAENFFTPLHIKHLIDWCPLVIKFLALKPGYRFLIGENSYEDVWYDEALLIQ